MSNKNNNAINYSINSKPLNDEIDLVELTTLLWKKKYRILLVTFICGCIGLLYAVVAPEQWTANATIYQPKQRDTLVLDRLRAALEIQGLAGAKNNNSIYNDFLLEFKSYDNISDFLQNTSQFKEYVVENKLDSLAQQRLLRTWSEWMTIEPADKKGEQPGIHLSFSFFKKEDALSLLTGYINYIILLQSEELLDILENNKNSQLSTLKLRIKMRTEDAQRNLAGEIENIDYSMSIANAAGVNKPLENFSYGDRFPITLGRDGLAKKLAILKSLKPEGYMPEIMELNVQLNRLKNINLNKLEFRPFSYLDTPSQPLTRDKPKRPLIVVLATMLGGMMGVALVLLQHAFRQDRNKDEYDYRPRLANVG
ncbi:Wzz/FepE/Etk N-terminal domain-containing protein [Aeromonas encheleia]|uniref:LPS O-antigen chain length determinant protein WzzB n=1 Tax=Aeromonas encheleia TaxID=73010 RepID=UPI001F57E67A|nr:Wzz/FepE/Etk N-terminal domain-containing protein [Aeromonas encheleia]UNP87399.1 Wzz/FepE/Etk N-terminal domain-containing protein [Aeromonas encheleia]